MRIVKNIIIIVGVVFFSISSYATFGITIADTKTKEDVIQFVKDWSSNLDNISNISSFIDNLPKRSFRLHLIDYQGKKVDLYSKGQFLRWYKDFKKNIDSNVHTIKNIAVQKVDAGSWKVSTTTVWSINLKGHEDLRTFVLEQEWNIEEDNKRGLQLVILNEETS